MFLCAYVRGLGVGYVPHVNSEVHIIRLIELFYIYTILNFIGFHSLN